MARRLAVAPIEHDRTQSKVLLLVKEGVPEGSKKRMEFLILGFSQLLGPNKLDECPCGPYIDFLPLLLPPPPPFLPLR